MTEIYVALTLWGVFWFWNLASTVTKTRMENDTPSEQWAIIAGMAVSTLAATIGVCGLIGGVL